ERPARVDGTQRSEAEREQEGCACGSRGTTEESVPRSECCTEQGGSLSEVRRYHGIVENPEKLRDSNGTAAAARQAGAINSFVKLELEYGPHASIHSDMAALTANVSWRTLRS
ncbi:unnamed protein product, partial [Pylaiella littoralis]